VKEGDVALHYGLHEAPDFTQIWQSGHDAFRVLTSRDETDMLRAFEGGLCQLRGDFLRALWFNEVMKLCRGPDTRASGSDTFRTRGPNRSKRLILN
jgi:hypothetical protein